MISYDGCRPGGSCDIMFMSLPEYANRPQSTTSECAEWVSVAWKNSELFSF